MIFKGEIEDTHQFDHLRSIGVSIDAIKVSKNVKWLSEVFSMMDETLEEYQDWGRAADAFGAQTPESVKDLIGRLINVKKAKRHAQRRIFELGELPPASMSEFVLSEKLKAAHDERKRLAGQLNTLKINNEELKKKLDELEGKA